VTAGLADDAAGLAAQLVSAERTIRDPASSPDAVADAGRRQQLAYRRLGANPDWEPAVTDAVPAELRAAFDANLAATTIRRRLAQEAAAAAATAPSTVATPAPPPSEAPPPVTVPTLPAWTIRAPKPAAELLGYYREAEAATGVPWQYLAAINLIETRMGRIVGVSSADAEGPMQFLPTTWAACCQGDVWDDHDAIIGAATYLAMSGAPDDMTAAVWQYNPNEAYLEMVTRYAEVMAADERAYLGYHAWEVFYGTPAGDVRLPEGYTAAAPIDAAAYLAAHPQDRA
jgi:membrane-bound lytic murein transglycosylase B